MSQIVCDDDATGVEELALAVRELIPHCLHLNVGDRIAELVDDASRDGAAARHAEIEALENLAVDEIE
jgi:hypothetical protein